MSTAPAKAISSTGARPNDAATTTVVRMPSAEAAGDLAVDGRCDARFGHVGEAFAENFARHGEVGAAVAVTIDGMPVVDLWAGHADAARMRPWTRDTIVNIASATKGLTATCAHRLADRGLLDLDAPVTTYWPEFAQAGKAAMPVHLLLSHRGRAARDRCAPAGGGTV